MSEKIWEGDLLMFKFMIRPHLSLFLLLFWRGEGEEGGEKKGEEGREKRWRRERGKRCLFIP